MFENTGSLWVRIDCRDGGIFNVRELDNEHTGLTYVLEVDVVTP